MVAIARKELIHYLPQSRELLQFPTPDRVFISLLESLRVDSLGQINWFHRANILSMFEKGLDNPFVQAIEIDIHSSSNGAVVAHDLSEIGRALYDYFLVLRGDSFPLSRGILLKLDCKDPQVVSFISDLWNQFHAQLPISGLIINADVLQGPDASPPIFVDPQKFIEDCLLFRELHPSTIISLGFTTVPGSSGYISEMIENVIALASLCQPATIALRVELATREIVEQCVQAGIPPTLWSDQDSPLSRNWWKEHQSELANYREVAFMDFPDCPSEILQKIKIN